jgi:hypothetical protein
MSQVQLQTQESALHCYAEFLLAIANGAKVEDFNIPLPAGHSSDLNTLLGDILNGGSDLKVTRKPLLKLVNGFKVKAPETALPSDRKYYVARPDLPKKFLETKNCHEIADQHYLNMGLVFLTANDAIAYANAMCGINPGEPH